jgi:DNA recombination protein RmuC
MDGMWTVFAAGVFLAGGVAIGLALRRAGARAAFLEASHAAERDLVVAQEQVAARTEQLEEARRRTAQLEQTVREQRERIVGTAAELAGARAAAADAAAQREALDALRVEAARVADARTRLAAELEAERRLGVERAAELERSREQVRTEVQTVAARLLEEKGAPLMERSRERLEALLAPLSERIRAFEQKVDRTYDQESRDRASLLERLRELQEAQKRLHEEADGLARALTGDSKAQGDWGELVLERVLETAGLAEGREYDLQVSRVDEEGGRKRPDAVVYLPGDRALVVDAKCSLTAFVAATRATSDAARDAALDAHATSLRGHVRGLAGKRYPELLGARTLDLVLLFVPSEAAFHAALARDGALYDEAMRQRVVLCSPTTLLAALRVVAHVWQTERQNANAQEIAAQAGKLLEKLAAFVHDLDDVGARLGQARESWEAARAKLATGKGNVMKRAGDVARLGAQARPDRIEGLLAEDGSETAPPPVPAARRAEG